MSEISKDVPLILRNNFNRNRFAKQRTASISKSARVNTWACSDLSKSLSSNLEGSLRSQLDRLTMGKSRAESTSVESLRNWANTKNGCRLGELVATNVPVECTGVLCDHKMQPHLETKDGYSEQPKHMRWSAHGLTYGSVFAKVFRSPNSAGEYVAKEVSLFVACNNCLDIWVGPMTKGDRRSDANWTFEAPPSSRSNAGSNGRSKSRNDKSKSEKKKTHQRNKQRLEKKKDENSNNNNSKATVINSIVKSVTPHEFNGHKVDPWKRVTVTMLKVYLKAGGVSASGNKDSLIQKCMDHMRSADPAEHAKILRTLSA